MLKEKYCVSYIMASIDGFDEGNFASFESNDTSEIRKLPSLPVDDILPQANTQVSVDETSKVSFSDKDETITSENDANVILPTRTEEARPDMSEVIQNFLSEYAPYMFAIIFIFVAYWYSQNY
jgi:hypothetical protein